MTSPQVTVVDPEETGKPHPPTHGYTPHPLLVSVLVVSLLLALYVANSLYEKTRTQKRASRKSAALPAAGEGKDGVEEGGKPPGEEEGEGPGQPKGGKAQAEDSDSDVEELTTEPLTEDTYGMAIASMVRDMSRLTREGGGAHRGIRLCRIGVSFKLLLINMSLQIFLLVCIANFAAARAVFSIRSAYSAFESHMYGGHTYMSEHNNARGLDDKYFNSSLFDTLPEETKQDACRIPFAQPEFLFVILLIWSLLVVGEIKESVTLFERLVVSTENTQSMADATTECEGGEAIVKLTVGLKAWVAFFIVLPRIFIASILLWLGCRWLSATTDFQNLVLNAVGLEFVLLLKELLYKSLVPPRDKRDTVRMHVCIAHEAARPSPAAFFGTFLWGFVAMAWVYLYIFCIQGVLPGFRWDVHDVCSQWMKDNYAGWS